MENKKGEVYAFETDTVWGFGCAPFDVEAVNKIYEIKNRDRSKPLILMSSSLENLLPYVKDVSQTALGIMKKAYPGALTAVLKKSSKCPDTICAGFDTVGIRVPKHKGFWELCEKIEGKVLATTSANVSNELPCADYEETCEKFGSLCTVIKPNQESLRACASTVAAFLPDDSIKILRQGDFII